MTIGLLMLTIYIPGCASLKEKRSVLRPLLNDLHRTFNISAAEIAYHDVWQTAQIGCVIISNDGIHNQRSLQKVYRWVEERYPNIEVQDMSIQLL